MALREQLLTIADIVLRVPPLFVMDSLLVGSFFILEIFSVNLPILTSAFLATFGLAFLVFCLSTSQLLDVYNCLLSVVVLSVSSWWNLHYLLEHQTAAAPQEPDSWLSWDTVAVISSSHLSAQRQDTLGSFALNFVVQLSLALIFVLLRIHGPLFKMMRNSRVGVSMLQGSVYLSLTLPIYICGADSGLSWQLPLLALGLPTVYMIVEFYLYFPYIMRALANGFISASQTIRTFGIQVFLEGQWIRLHIPIVLQTFWLTRLAYQLVLYGWLEMYDSLVKTGELSYANVEMWNSVGRQVLIRGCETVIAVLGLTSVVSYIAHYIGIFMAFCINSNNEEDKNMGTVSAILFFILALQTGLTSLEPEKRLVRLYRNFCLLFTALLHFIHSMVNPLLMSLSASRNLTLSRHIRVLTMCMFLVSFPALLLVYLWSHNPVSTWLLAVTAFSVEVMIKVFFSLMVYILFLIDAYGEGFWEKLDDYVYYVKSAGSTIEFLFGIFLFCNGGWIMLFESGGTIRAVMMCIHAYFNIWLQAKKGWQVFMKRRTAVQKINSLPIATPEQLREVDDICAICYSELNNARMTRCHHFFHGVCLRKWLYVQDRCPLCHELIYAPEAASQENSPVAGGRQNHDVQPEPNVVELGNNAEAEVDQNVINAPEDWGDFDSDDDNVIINEERIGAQNYRDVIQDDLLESFELSANIANNVDRTEAESGSRQGNLSVSGSSSQVDVSPMDQASNYYDFEETIWNNNNREDNA